MFCSLVGRHVESNLWEVQLYQSGGGRTPIQRRYSVFDERDGVCEDLRKFRHFDARLEADCVLHTAYRTVEEKLQAFEEQVLMPAVGDILHGMIRAVPHLLEKYGLNGSVLGLSTTRNVLQCHIADAELVLLVGIWILEDQGIPCDGELRMLLLAMQDGTRREVVFFSQPREVDFAAFRPTGHYNCSEPLRRYYKCRKWLKDCGLLYILADLDETAWQSNSLHQLRAALIFLELGHLAGKLEALAAVEELTRNMVCQAACSISPGLTDICCKAGVALEDMELTSESQLEVIWLEMVRWDAGLQRVTTPTGEEDEVSLDPEQEARVICLFSPDFMLDTFTLMKIMNGGETDIAATEPSGLAGGFGTFGSGTSLQRVVEQMERLPATNVDVLEGEAFGSMC
eukprot:TRINITY_DN9229_c0_g1_i2.p1 TRINITY_DN9229_c0_g1~~TRINITY_DN9229_c0_g1_i2.p1  ORF type:complete len:407 (+),score=68.50 TRINITY_DN9229_c0_g1_i2:27-1223(+)